MWNLLAGLIKPLIDCFQRRSEDTPREERLRELLTNMPDGIEWLSIELLSESIGADKNETARLLIRIGARRSTGNNNVWALKSNKPI
jgi:hypothetical protein